uniref:Diamine acetyltransferase 1 n=1 Tax=Cynoglossus semilaevis TaxID=244447 RepID=A0A3P8WD48_CYNSE
MEHQVELTERGEFIYYLSHTDNLHSRPVWTFSTTWCCVAELLEDGFGETPCYHCVIAEVNDVQVVGFAMYYLTYDPWVGKQLYLEEFYVMAEYRGLGIGSEVLRYLSDLAMKLRCTGIMFVVAENNEPSMQFYKRRGAEDLSEGEGWRLFRFDKDSLVKMAAPSEE